MPRPRADIDEDVRWLGTGFASTLPIRSRKRKPPVGFIWPKEFTRKPRRKRRAKQGGKK